MALGFLGLIAVLSRFATIPFFSMRIWLYIIFLLSIILGIFTFVKTRKDYKRRLESAKREKRKKGK